MLSDQLLFWFCFYFSAHASHHVRQDRDYVEKSGKNRGIRRERGIKVDKKEKRRDKKISKKISKRRKTKRMSK